MLNVKNLKFSYGNNVVFENVNFNVYVGDSVAILGNNGAGKSTMIKCLNKILIPAKGEILLGNKNMGNMHRIDIAKNIAYVAQIGETSHVRVFDAVMLGRKPYIKFMPSEKDYNIVENVLKKLGIADLSLCYINEISGGQLQKVMLARALAQQPKILLLDEPTNYLDIKSQHALLKNVVEIVKEKNICAIMVLHDINLALRYCNKFIFLKDNSIYSINDANSVNEKIIKDVFNVDVVLKEICGHKVIVPIDKENYENF